MTPNVSSSFSSIAVIAVTSNFLLLDELSTAHPAQLVGSNTPVKLDGVAFAILVKLVSCGCNVENLRAWRRDRFYTCSQVCQSRNASIDVPHKHAA